MPAETAYQAAETFRQALLRRERAAEARLVRAYGAVYQRLRGQVDALAAELDALHARGELLSPARVNRLERLQNLKRQVADEIARYAAVVETEIDAGAAESVRAALSDARALTQATLPGFAELDARIMGYWQSLDPQAVRTALGFLADDSPLRASLRERFGPAVAEQVGQALVEGIALGYNPRKVYDLARRALGQGLTWSLTSVRTAQLNAYREATRLAYAANQEIVPRWRWRSARDDRTCMSCIAMDGTVHPVTERLNDHHNGRCVMVPVTITYRELGFDVDEPASVLAQETGEEWFASLAEAQQRQMLGREFHAAWRAGRFTLADIPTTYTDPVYGPMRRAATLRELTHATAAA